MNASPLFLILLISHVYARDVDYCFADEDDPYLYMATKTAYHFVHAGKTRFQDVPNCRPKQIWILATHGTRCPTRDEIGDMLKLTESQISQIVSNHETRNNGRMCNRDLENLKKWKPDEYLAIERAEVLTPQGVEDMKLLARRLQSNFPQLLQPSSDYVTAENYVFKTTDARDSMESFMEGLFGNRNAVEAEDVPVNDTLLTMYKTCNAWEGDRSNTSSEVVAFEEGVEFQNLIQNVSRRLGFLSNISKESILTMYNMCRYTKAWRVTQLSPWCAVFSKEELRVLEYREDLYYYHKAGYGCAINARLGCTLLQDMMNHFWKATQEDQIRPRGVFYFSDIISLQNLLTTLNINKDHMEPTAYNYKEMAKRQWRTSLMSSFAANLVAVLYKCDESREPNKVMFYLAEKLVMLDGCDVGLCDWQYLKQKFNPVLKNCNLNVCWNGNGAMATFVPNIALIVLSCFTLVLARK